MHELDLFQRGTHVYALLATPFSEFFDTVPGGDFRIVDATDPRNPVQVSEWGAAAHGLTPGPLHGLGSFGASYDHSARASADGTKAYLSYWDLGVLTLDIRDVTNPVLISRTRFPAGVDGDAHSVSVYQGEERLFLLQNDEDFDPRSPARISFRGGRGIGNESPGAAPLWLRPRHRVSARVVMAANEGCEAVDYPTDTPGSIVVLKTPFPFLDPDLPPDGFPLCPQELQDTTAAAAGAAAVVHDFMAVSTSPQPLGFGVVDIPVLYTDHATAQGMVAAGKATLSAPEPSWGFLRVFDAATGKQVATFDDVENVHTLPSPPGFWALHNSEVTGHRAYLSWYSAGIIALDLSPLNEDDPDDPKKVGQFIPEGAASHTPFLPSDVPNVWGVAIRQATAEGNGEQHEGDWDQDDDHDGDDHGDHEEAPIVFLSDMNSGLWIVRPVGKAAP